MTSLLSFLFVLILFNNVCAFNILAIISQPRRSHYMAFSPLFRELANRGHNVTVINNYPEENGPKNLKFIDILAAEPHDPEKTKKEALLYFSDNSYTYSHFLNYFGQIWRTPEAITKDCDNLFQSEVVNKERAKGVKYDVIFVEQFMSDCALAYAGAMYEAPIIGITSHVLLPWSYPRLGLPFDSSSDLFYFSGSGHNPTIYYRVENFLLHHFFNTFGRWLIQRYINEAFQRHLPDYSLDVEQIAEDRMKMVFSYQHFALTGARNLAPQLLEIGGIHIETPKKIPEDIELFLRGADQGAIYVSFGTNLNMSTISDHKIKIFLDAFNRIQPLKVIWKFENDSLPAGNDNVLIKSWLPQVDVLCHPKVVGFISHGGMLSSSEAAYCGVPVVVVPFYGDQFQNSASIQACGLGKVLFFYEITGLTLAEAIKEVTSEASQERAKKVSALWHDRPLPVMDSAIFWTEYVARHPEAPPSLPTKTASWLASTHMDVYAVLTVVMTLLVVFLYASCKVFASIISSFVKFLVGRKKIKKH